MDVVKGIETFKRGEDESSSMMLFGRICTTNSRSCQPAYLSDACNRKTVFLFGADTVKKASEKKPFELLVHLGLLPEYIHLKACLQQASYWLVLLKQDCDEGSTPPIVPATWGGLKAFVSRYYPLAAKDVTEHWTALTGTPIEAFEAAAGFKFIQALEAAAADDAHDANLFMSYANFCKLQRPVKAWQVRCFLYCELRIFELFKGDGFTYRQDGCKGEREYIAPNFKLSDQREGYVTVIPLNIDIPEDVHSAAEQCNLRKK